MLFFVFFFISAPNFLVVTSGYGDSGYLSNTETIDIENNSDSPYYPNHPRKIWGATGGFLHQDFVTCGGNDWEEGSTNKCYMLGSEKPFATMMTEREYAASIVLDPGKLWILGGYANNYRLSSTEYIFSDGRNEEGPPMPIALYGHAMVKINETTSFLVGGYSGGNSKRTWYYNGNWIEGPNLHKGRYGHSVGIVRDPVTDQVYVVVAGGNSFIPINDVEILSVTGTAWESGKLLYL